MTTIIGLSGKKQSGKSSLAAYLEAYFELKFNGVPFDDNRLVQSPGGERVYIGPNPADWKLFLPKSFEQHVKIYSFADPIKEFCIDVLGINKEQVYGTDAEKNVPTEYKWDNIPKYMRPIVGHTTTTLLLSEETLVNEISIYKEGCMTAREVMQVIGTEIMRNMFSPNVWVNACIRKIQKDKPRIAIIADLRFPSELEAVMKAEGYVIRLERKLFEDNHASEISLDNVKWNENPRALVVPPSEDINSKNNRVREWINKIITTNQEEVNNVSSSEQVSS